MDPKTIVLCIILLLVVSSCEKQVDSSNPLDSFSIVYLKGSSWTDYSYKAELNKNGLLSIDLSIGINNYSRRSDFQISNDDITSIEEELIKVNRINLEKSYGFGPDKPFDLPITFIKYSTESKTDSTTIYFPIENELPTELESFLLVIEKVIADNDYNSN